VTGLNENHKTRLRTTFAYVDGQLAEALSRLDPVEAESPFAAHVPDATPIQRRVLADYISRLRGLLLEVLERHGITLPPPAISSIWAFRTTLTLARIAMEEARPKYLRGYGELKEDAAAEVEADLAQILDLMGRMEAYLAQGSAGELAARLARLELTREAVALVQELARIITAHGLVEFRGALEMLVERLESPGLEVAVFGRVNSGKSSLLNYLLQADVLPVGATPVTGLPTRVRYAAEPDARVQFAQSPHQIIPLDRVVEFATEQSNPANAKQVLRIDIALPSPILKDGAVLVDTPGLGSLATAGAAESLAYLPRCDLGLVLVDAGSALGPDDVALVDALHRAGAGVMALLSKADVMPSDDRDRAVDYMREQLRAHTGTETPVYPVSVRGEHAVLCGQWLTSALGPQLEDQRSAAERSLRRKIGALREAVIAAF
jgi:GTP-binding protein EngB required for normal cell division